MSCSCSDAILEQWSSQKNIKPHWLRFDLGKMTMTLHMASLEVYVLIDYFACGRLGGRLSQTNDLKIDACRFPARCSALLELVS